MKTPTKLHVILAVSLILLASTALAGNVKDEKGYMDLEWIDIPEDASAVQDIDLTDILKTVAKDVAEEGDENLAQILSMIRSIRVKGFGLDGVGNAEVEKAVDKITAQMKKKDWKRLIYLKDDEEILSVNTMYDGEDLVGLMVMAYKPGEEVMFANIVGDLDLGVIMSLVGGIDGDGLGDLLEGLDDMEIEIDSN